MPTFDQWDLTVRVAAVVATAAGLALPGGLRRRAGRVAQRPWSAAALVAIVSLGVNAAVAGRHGIPAPRVHDEFSYLLAADTFAHGRLTNPTPACADSFQSPHVLVRPTYASKYPPGQAVALAAGQLLGRPVYGAWLSAAVAAVAVGWMLAAFVGPEWALLGGLVAAVHPQLVDWGGVYWGGSVAVIGGALVVGGWGRLMRRPVPAAGGSQRTVDPNGTTIVNTVPGLPPAAGTDPGASTAAAAALGVGLVVLANSRPYEGLVLAVPLWVVLAWRLVGTRGLEPAAAVALLGVLVAGGAATGWYDHRVTGHAGRLPFAEYAGQFDVYPKFWFLPRHAPPAEPNAVMAEVHAVKERGRFDLLRTWPGRAATAVEWARRLWAMHARPAVLLVPLAAAGLVRPARWAWAVVGLFLVGLMAENWFLPHYAAPVVPVVVLLMVMGWRRLAEWDGPAGPFARRLGRGVAVGFFVAAGLSALAPADPALRRFARDDLLRERPELAAGRQLVFVRYAADHPVEDEWVYNGADLAGQRVLWARSLGPTQDAAVAAAYGPRRAWVLTVGRSTHGLAGYTGRHGPEAAVAAVR